MRSGEDPYLQHYYGIDFDARNLTPITKANAYHTVAFSADLAFYVDNYSRTDLPNIMELYLFVAKGRDGKTDIRGLIVRPLNLDPAKKYPVVENNYAGPHGSFVPKTFWPFGFQSGGDKMIGMRSMANRGFVVGREIPLVRGEARGHLRRLGRRHRILCWRFYFIRSSIR